MLINETSKLTGLTKKAIDYYTLQGLVCPTTEENGYRNYNQEDIETLKKISILRKLDISVEEIKLILEDRTNSAIKNVLNKKEIESKRSLKKNQLLQKLSEGSDYPAIENELESLEKESLIIDKLIKAFPGYWGRISSLHFARFLQEPIHTEAQQTAYETVINFLDNLPEIPITEELASYLDDMNQKIETQQLTDVMAKAKESIENPDDFLANDREVLEVYLKFRQSDDYRNSPAGQLMELMKQFNQANGYNDIFIPAMKELSPAYQAYCNKVEIANQKLLAKYPEIEKMIEQPY